MPPGHASFASRKLACLLCLALGAMAASAPAAVAGPGFLTSIWGPIKFVPGQAGCSGPERCSSFPIYRELRPDVLQFQLQWNQIAPTRPAHPRNPNDPAYHWSSEFKFAVKKARASGERVMFMLRGSPPWANGGRAARYAPDPARLANFATAAARKFSRVHLWEVWGETNRSFDFLPGGRKGARRYARILDAAYGALKKVRRGNVVVGGMTLSGGARGDVTPVPRWIKAMRLPNGKPPRMDWFGHNPYDRRYPRIKVKPISSFRGIDDVDTLWSEVKQMYRTRHGKHKWVRDRGRPRQLWLSEWGMQTDHASSFFSFHVSPKKQAKWLRAGFALARKLPYVKGMGWFELSDEPPGPTSPSLGLIRYSGARKPAFRAYRSLP
jgi:hypothetical protein